MDNIRSTFRFRPLRVWSILFSLFVSSPSSSTGAETAPETPQFALLIGVGQYPNLGPGEQLDGSSNDVAAMRGLLVERFGFDAKNITTLIDKRATGDGIRQTMRDLIAAIEQLPAGSPPAQVVVHFSGHGSQIPDQASGPDRDEDDGLDETWVPYDATRQGGTEDIRDDEINQLVHAICGDGKARLLIVFDCCHSGTGARGLTKMRQLPRDVTPTKVSAEAPITPKRLPEEAVFLSACRAQEVEPEFQDDDKSYGLLTRFLVQTLSEERVVSRLSYDLLQKAIVANYQRDRRVMQAPVPQLEGNAKSLGSTILGFGPDVDRPPYFDVEATSSTEQVLLRAGRFHQVTVGSLFELYERPEQTTDATAGLAWLQISKVDGTTSQAQVIRWEDGDRTKPLAGKLPASFKNGFALLRLAESGDSGLKLKVVRATGQATDSAPLDPSDSALPKHIVDALRGVKKTGETPWLHWVTKADQPCDLVLRMDGNYAALFPATGLAEVLPITSQTRGDVPASLRGGWGPFDLRIGKDTSDSPQDLADYLRRITRARNLVSLAQSGADRGASLTRSASEGASDYQVKLELLNIDYDEPLKRIVSTKLWEPDQDRVVSMRENQQYAFRVTNQQTVGKPIYVTVLEIGPGQGIQVVMPYEEPLVKLEPGENRISDPFRCSAPHGLNHVILLATREPADFRFVAQSELPRTRGAPPSGGAGSLTDQLAEFTHFQPPQTRGQRLRPKPSDTTWHAEILTWKTSR